MDGNNRTDRASIFIRADAADVYAALTDGRAVLQWLPPNGAIGTIEKFEPHVGGRFEMTLHFPGNAGGGKTTRDSDQVSSRFTALEPGRLVRWAGQFVSDEPRYAGTMTMSWNLMQGDKGTAVQLVAQDVPAGINPEDHRIGLQSSLEQLAKHVERSVQAVHR